MKATCSLSGLKFEVSYFESLTLQESASVCHPVFSWPQKKLYAIACQKAGALSDKERYLLALALLASTGKVQFLTSASFSASATPKILANNWGHLLSLFAKLQTVSRLASFPSFSISAENRDLGNLKHWLSVWETSLTDYTKTVKQRDEEEKQQKAEEKLLKLFQKQEISPAYAASLADWAATAACFPAESSDLWRAVIRRCVSEQSILAVPADLLQQITEHCENNIDPGTAYAHNLFSLLRKGAKASKDPLDLGGFELKSGSYSIISVAGNTVEDKTKLDLLASAPSEKPVLSAYPTKLAYIQALARWELAVQASKQTSNSGETTL
jgi:hypothetical protein